ncbi:unnamed protein product [Durusdinium trenchii]|uniref:CUE domain-containing protein n=1 Tax=Durusdinium trenchii TaxID=1381693 RepID=A0ABP0HIF5_9DINO
MFPEEPKAVEEALLRFAGSSHQASRALEALLARPDSKTAEDEDDLDYDCADAGVAEVDEDEWEEDWEDEEYGEYWEDEDDDAPGACSFCGAAGDAELAEDGEFYCSRCWEEWAEGTAAEEPPPSASAPAPARRWGARREEHKAMPATPAEREPAAVPSGLGKAFFQSLDGAPQWADAPTRPEAGGKELVALRPKEERGTEEMASKKGPKAQLLTPGAATAPTAPSPTATSSSARSEPRFEELLRSLQPRLGALIVRD